LVLLYGAMEVSWNPHNILVQLQFWGRLQTSTNGEHNYRKKFLLATFRGHMIFII